MWLNYTSQSIHTVGQAEPVGHHYSVTCWFKNAMRRYVYVHHKQTNDLNVESVNCQQRLLRWNYKCFNVFESTFYTRCWKSSANHERQDKL